jgi:hypothetical protein
MCNGHLKDTLINSRIGEQLTNLLKIEKKTLTKKQISKTYLSKSWIISIIQDTLESERR